MRLKIAFIAPLLLVCKLSFSIGPTDFTSFKHFNKKGTLTYDSENHSIVTASTVESSVLYSENAKTLLLIIKNDDDKVEFITIKNLTFSESKDDSNSYYGICEQNKKEAQVAFYEDGSVTLYYEALNSLMKLSNDRSASEHQIYFEE